MNNLHSFYNDKITLYESQLAVLKKQLFASSMIRLIVFCIAAFAIYFFFGSPKLVLGIVILAIILFLALVSRHTNLQYKRDKLLALIKINSTEIQVLDRNYHHLATGTEFKDPEHYFSQDIDLFGKGSFFQYCNRTALPQGSETLAALLKENALTAIDQKQQAIMELAKMPDWRQNFSAIASLVKTETPYTVIIKWMKQYESFVPAIMKFLPMLFSIASVIIITGYFMGWMPGLVLIGWFFLGLVISGRFLKKINKLSNDTAKIQTTFQQYKQLIEKLEDTDFQCDLLAQRRRTIVQENGKASSVLHQFSRHLSALDQRNNILIAFFANAFLLRDLQLSFAIEKWVGQHGNDIEAWFETIAFFDAYNSLGNFGYNHPDYTYPRLVESGVVLKSEAAGHPLLDPQKSILNDVEIDDEQFFIITGANMAGKSTFLRTVSLQIVMANMGLPVCASHTEYHPIKLITSMRTTDSLTDDESYFFSELKRLKYIVDEIQNDRYFIVLDEILKGTNSTDKAKGSRKFVERLVASKSTGIIATHDLSLCEVVEELPQVKNYYFDAEIIDHELHFDYKFKKGICQNMNASFLLKKMGIV
ncbi:DNA mismatch repair protein MutS [uncultured Kriegella sp.]|uniref:MutS-related protein n=1 Tax=uncultured Kriegella sp. TaxID=1798910 RepID=UPI0030DD6370|tara:strand:- start:13094 stop:14863 length:1770 start_codon:yes stop_codon:yes gene_type:complete